MTQKMPSTRSQAVAFAGLAFVTVAFAAVVTFTTAATIPPTPPPTDALSYMCDQHKHIKKLIVDVDAGVDDAMALIMALAKHQPGYPEVIAITCTHGNTKLNNVVINVLRVLKLLKLNIPVYPGASSSLLITPSGDNFFGIDGLGDVPDPSPPSLSEAEEEHAAVALGRLARKYAGELGVIALGPLTNLALAQRLDPEFKTNAKQIYWMGGSVEGIGNIKPGIEFNAFMDPEANYIVFNATGPPVITLSWETCLYHGSISKQWRQDVFGKIDSPLVKFLNEIEAHSLQKSKKWSPCDAKALAVLLDPTVATKAVMHNVEPIYQGDARGALMVDYKDSTGQPKNAVLVTMIDAEKFKKMCVENFSQSAGDKTV